MKLRDFSNILLIFLSSIIITIIIPGIISALNDTFYKETFESKLPQEQKSKLATYQHQLDSINNEIRSFNVKLKIALLNDDSLKPGIIDSLLESRDYYEKEKSKLTSPINLIPFYLNPQMLLWLGIYAALLILLYLIRKAENIPFTITKRAVSLALLMYIFYEWPLWLRNFVLNTKGRTVYAYPNFDIDKYSFIYQEILILLFCLFISLLIDLNIESNKKREPLQIQKNDINKFLLISNVYSASYRDWLLHSVILAFGFLSFTGFFWRLVFDYGDQRYILSAVNAHVIWAITWISISMPLFRSMGYQDKAKRELLRLNPDENTLKIILEYQPASNLTIVLSGIASLTTFISPIIKALLTK